MLPAITPRASVLRGVVASFRLRYILNIARRSCTGIGAPRRNGPGFFVAGLPERVVRTLADVSKGGALREVGGGDFEDTAMVGAFGWVNVGVRNAAAGLADAKAEKREAERRME
jgi:hypothetical protein